MKMQKGGITIYPHDNEESFYIRAGYKRVVEKKEPIEDSTPELGLELESEPEPVKKAGKKAVNK